MIEKIKKHLHTIQEPNPVRQGVMESRDIETYNSYEVGEKVNEIIEKLNNLKKDE